MLLFIEKKIYYKNMMKNVLKLDNYIALEKPTCWQIKHTMQLVEMLVIFFPF